MNYSGFNVGVVFDGLVFVFSYIKSHVVLSDTGYMF